MSKITVIKRQEEILYFFSRLRVAYEIFGRELKELESLIEELSKYSKKK